MEKRELVALLSFSSWRLVIIVGLFLAMLWVCLPVVIVVFPDHTHLLFLIITTISYLASDPGPNRCFGPDAVAVVRPIRVYLLEFFCSSVQFYVLLSPYLCFNYFLYLDPYVLGDIL